MLVIGFKERSADVYAHALIEKLIGEFVVCPDRQSIVLGVKI
jgi:hypothetical protein